MMHQNNVVGSSGGSFANCAFCNLFSAMSTLMQVQMFGHLQMGHQDYVKLEPDVYTDLNKAKDGTVENVLIEGDMSGSDSDFDFSKDKVVLVENLLLESDLTGSDQEEVDVKPNMDQNLQTSNENTESKLTVDQYIDPTKNIEIKPVVDQHIEKNVKQQEDKFEDKIKDVMFTKDNFIEESSKIDIDCSLDEVKDERNEGFDSIETNEDGSLTRYIRKEVDLQMINPNLLPVDCPDLEVQPLALKVSKKKKSYSCPDCPKQFWFHKSFLGHCNSRHKRFEGDCPPKMLKSEKIKSPVEPIACTDCDKTFHVQRRLTDHVNKCHVKTSSAPCEQCGKVVKSSNMDTHIKMNHEAARFSCELCPKTFYYNSGLKIHEDVHKDVREKTTMLCVECGNTYTSRNALRRHINSVHKNIRHPCYWCHKLFTSNQHLQKHILTHTNPHIYMCTLCEAKFLHKDNHRMHVVKAHPGQDHKNIIIVMDSNDKGEVIFEVNNVKKKIVIEKGVRNSLRQVQ